MTMMVCFLLSLAMVFRSRVAVSSSTCAVASSSKRTFLLATRALARHMSCLCPTDRLTPPSFNGVSSLTSSPSFASFPVSPTSSSASATTESECELRGSTASLTVCAIWTGSCGIMAILDRSSRRGRREMSTESSRIRPEAHGITRRRAMSIEDFPAPVLPQNPTDVELLTCSEIPFNTSGPSCLYLHVTLSQTISPFDGQPGGSSERARDSRSSSSSSFSSG
mmetsp:Transcript_27207/g.88911  ORF Transcript_27207/g.88911 Transcript_27207/m.88911 type:complete len:223 (+) Transcript_27207:354-1022(+)